VRARVKRVAIAVALCMPGLACALAAKPLILGDGALFLGIAVAFLLPVGWIILTSNHAVHRGEG
jgi:hypothetical protein